MNNSKLLSYVIFLFFNTAIVRAQVQIPNKEYAVYEYNTELKADILTYHYTDLWDLDGDGIDDSLSFVSNDGAHAYYHFKLRLSSGKEWIEYPSFYIDMPYPDTIKATDELKDTYPQFVVDDFDKDGRDEVYLNIDNPFGSIPRDMQEKGLTSKRILLKVKDGEVVLENFKVETR
jgi:hypothetical protein